MILELMTPYEVMEQLTKNIEIQRVRRNLKQSELAYRSGVPLKTYQNLLYKKKGSFENIIKILFTLNMESNLKNLLEIPEYTSIEEIRAKNKNKEKKRVKSKTKKNP